MAERQILIDEIHQNDDIKNFIIKWGKNPVGSAIFAGKNGTGKSFAAKAIYYFNTPYILPARDWDLAIFIPQVDLNGLFLKQMKEYGDPSYLINELVGAKLLIIDDLGTRIPSEAFCDFLYSIMDKRYGDPNKGTLITTNISITQMRDQFGEAFVSRTCSGHVIKFNGSDRRYDASYSQIQTF